MRGRRESARERAPSRARAERTGWQDRQPQSKVYLRGSRIKAEIGLVQGKKLYDKRETKRTQELDREAAAAIGRGKAGRGDSW